MNLGGGEPRCAALRANGQVDDGWLASAWLDAVTGVCTDDIRSTDLVKLAVESLADKSLLWVRDEADTTRFDMLEIVREYARERLLVSDEEAVLRRRHAEFFAALAEQAQEKLRGSEQMISLQRLEADHAENAWKHAWASGRAAPVEETVGPLLV